MELIKSIYETQQNAKNFNRITRDSNTEALRQFSRFFHWYYFPHLNIFAPSKFIGYMDTTIKNYDGTNGKTGTKTQKVLRIMELFAMYVALISRQCMEMNWEQDSYMCITLLIFRPLAKNTVLIR